MDHALCWLLQDYMQSKRYKYTRLDGSSRISERRDMVEDFQTNSDIFVFLLSTRAGGLGINLTAADTVIFFDSDWNPTVDQQVSWAGRGRWGVALHGVGLLCRQWTELTAWARHVR